MLFMSGVSWVSAFSCDASSPGEFGTLVVSERRSHAHIVAVPASWLGHISMNYTCDFSLASTGSQATGP